MADISILLAFGAGALAFISPCVFPLYPAFLSYITGMRVAEIQSGVLKGQRKAIFHTLFFLFGFSIICFLINMFSNIAFALVYWLLLVLSPISNISPISLWL